jgi:hypothetical protein
MPLSGVEVSLQFPRLALLRTAHRPLLPEQRDAIKQMPDLEAIPSFETLLRLKREVQTAMNALLSV